MRRSGHSPFGKKALFDEDDANPMETVANLSDVMLVLAVALMVAIISRFNVDLNQSVDVSQAEQVDASISDMDVDSMQSSGYNEIGMVYEDPNTGEMYVIREQ